MANNPQARKRIRQTATRTTHNTTLRSRMRTEVKKLEKAIEAGEKTTIGTQFTETMRTLHKAASKGIIKKETASRKISRLSSRIKGLGA